ncbi:MAG TPA: hypothetical protein ENI85_18205, partial [Deltaproteobacteria bacterium]|nr:hypothetical protein [Deltaproteobacteria bacterium]
MLAGIAIGLFILAISFKRIPTDLQRLGVLIQSLKDGHPRPELVVFGNSVVMSGIDAEQLARSLPTVSIGWNCASTGQTETEAFLLSQEMPDTVRLAIYGLQIRPGEEEQPLHPQKYNTLFMYGFRPTQETRAELISIFGSSVEDVLNRSELGQIFDSRWALRQFIDTFSRRLLRPDLSLDRATFDLFHPQTYSKRIDEETTAKLIRKRNLAYTEDPPALAYGTVALSMTLAKKLRSRGVLPVFFFPPIHPSYRE